MTKTAFTLKRLAKSISQSSDLATIGDDANIALAKNRRGQPTASKSATRASASKVQELVDLKLRDPLNALAKKRRGQRTVNNSATGTSAPTMQKVVALKLSDSLENSVTSSLGYVTPVLDASEADYLINNSPIFASFRVTRS